MTVFVDDMYLEPMGAFRRMKMSHMIADTEEELHAMADRIGVDRRWYQKKRSGYHYDIAMSKRALAVAAGAVEITLRQAAAMNALRRFGHPFGDPADAIERYRAISAQLVAERQATGPVMSGEAPA